MVAHRDSKHPQPHSRLSDAVVTEKLDRLAKLAEENPKVAAAIREQLEMLTLLEIAGLTSDELDKLNDRRELLRQDCLGDIRAT